MQFPFLNAIKSTASGTPGSGAFTPNAASTGYMDWSTVPVGWWGLVRFEDGSAWELRYCYWNGTTITRPSNIVASSSGSTLTLSSSATAELVGDGTQLTADMSRMPPTAWIAWANTTGGAGIGCNLTTDGGTAGVGSVSNTNFLTSQNRQQWTSATTANAVAGGHINPRVLASSTAGMGGWEFTATFGVSQLPTNPRLVVGMWGTGTLSLEPSARAQPTAAFAKDSTDTNIQLLTSASTSGPTNKADIGIPLVLNSWYYARLWSLPGSLTVYALLVRLDTGDIFYTSTTTDVPQNGSTMLGICEAALNSTNTGTAVIFHSGIIMVR